MKLNILIIISISLLCIHGVNCQEISDTSVLVEQDFDEVRYIPNFRYKYNRALKQVRKVYPLALHAKAVLDSLDNGLERIDKSRKKNKYAKAVQKDLNADFKFLVRELYVSEGRVLAKLIHRETGMTIYDILKKYRSKTKADFYDGMSKLWDQDLKLKYKPTEEDYVMELVISNIYAGVEKFDSNFELVDRSHYRADRKAYKARIKRSRRLNKQRKKDLKKRQKLLKKAENKKGVN